MERGRQRRIDLGPVGPRRRQNSRSRNGRCGLRPLPPLSRRHCDHEATEPEELSLFDFLGEDSAHRTRCSQPERNRPLQARNGCVAGCGHSSLLHDLPLGPSPGDWRTAAAGRTATLPGTLPTLPAILAKNLGDRVTVWAPFNMPRTFTRSMAMERAVFRLSEQTSISFSKRRTPSIWRRANGLPRHQSGFIESYCGQRLWHGAGLSKDQQRGGSRRGRALSAITTISTVWNPTSVDAYPQAFIGEIPYEAMGFKPATKRS